MNSVVRQYLKEISEALHCPKSAKSFVIGELKDSVLEFAEKHVAVTLDELYHEFGFPNVISDSFYNREDFKELMEKAKKNAFLWKCMGVVLPILLVVATTLAILLYKDIGGTITISDIC